MKRSRLILLVSVLASLALVTLALVAVRQIGAEAYAAYRARGGEKGFWSWFARDACGVPVPGVAQESDEPSVRKRAARDELAKKSAAAARELAIEEKRLERLERELKERLSASFAKERKAGGRDDASKRQKTSRGHAGGGAVKTGGKSSHVAADGKTPYRVTGIQGIEFGTSDNAPGEGVKPILQVAEEADGSLRFRDLRWREQKSLTDPVYGFDKAWLNHSYESEQLSSVTFNKSFPFTEEGMQQAMDFYKSMSAEASADLGFDVIDVDRTGNLKSSTVCEFRNGDGDTSIRGAINAWSDKSLTVTFSVTDKAYAQEAKTQASAAYQAGVADTVDAKIEVVNRDYTAQKQRVMEYLRAE